MYFFELVGLGVGKLPRLPCLLGELELVDGLNILPLLGQELLVVPAHEQGVWSECPLNALYMSKKTLSFFLCWSEITPKYT